jgi:membrane-associated phospholipid phosphatase
LRQVRRSLERLAPWGWRHFWIQVAILGSFEIFYAASGIYGRAEAKLGEANARTVIRVEHSLGLAREHAIQRWTLGMPHLVLDVANRTYFLSQFVVSTAFLLWAYAVHTDRFSRLRNALVAANGVALIVLFVYPVAPPRMTPGSGLIDTLSTNRVSLHSALIDALNNPYSAMPSLHASYAIAIGAAGVVLTRSWWARLLWAAYPALVIFSVIATGNHFVLDVIAGAAALLSTPLVDFAARRLARHQPTTWRLEARRSVEL